MAMGIPSAHDTIKQLLIMPLILHMLMANERFGLESDTSKKAAGALLKFQQGQWLLIGYHSKK